jgi:hypothetical protein
VKLDDRVHAARTDLDAFAGDAPVPAASRIRARHRRRRALQAGAGALALVAVALGVSSVVDRNDASEPVILTPPSTEPSGPLGTRIDLERTTIQAGESIRGALVVTNDGNQSLDLDECEGTFRILLVPAGSKGAAIDYPTCDASARVFPPGETRVDFVIFETAVPPGRYETAMLQPFGMTMSPADPVRVTVVAAEPTTTTSTSTPPSFPAANDDLVQGGTTWAVILGGATVEPGTQVEAHPAIVAAVAAAQQAGYQAGPTDCDAGAATAMNADPDAIGFTSVSVYFSSEADAHLAADQFVAAGHPTAVVAQVQTFCMD